MNGIVLKTNIDRIFQLLQLVSHLLVNNAAYGLNVSNKLTYISGQFEALSILRLVLNLLLRFDTETMSNDRDIEDLKNKLYASILDSVNAKYFNEGVNFKTKQTIEILHAFIVNMLFSINKFVQ